MILKHTCTQGQECCKSPHRQGEQRKVTLTYACWSDYLLSDLIKCHFKHMSSLLMTCDREIEACIQNKPDSLPQCSCVFAESEGENEQLRHRNYLLIAHIFSLLL